jgi:hypothetical protein
MRCVPRRCTGASMVPSPGFPFCASGAVGHAPTFSTAGTSGASQVLRRLSSCMPRRPPWPIRVVWCCLRCAFTPSASATSAVSKLYQHCRVRVHWLPVVPSSPERGACALGTHPRVGGFPARRLRRPIRHSWQTSGLRPGSPPSSCPRPFPSCEELPVCSMADAHGTRQVACSPCPCRSLRLPSL